MTADTPASQALYQPFWDAVAGSGLALPRCAACARWSWPMRAQCPHCAGELQWAPASGRGALESWSRVERPPRAAFAAIAPYSVAFVHLDEGVRLLAHVREPAGGGLRQGMALVCDFPELEPEGGGRLPVFSVVATDVNYE